MGNQYVFIPEGLFFIKDNEEIPTKVLYCFPDFFFIL